MSDIMIIAISGGSGSGKTFLAQAIHENLGDHASSVISQDSYYIDQSKKFDHDGGSVNFDHPNAIDFELLSSDLKNLKLNKNINMPHYDFATHSRQSDYKELAPTSIIIVEGILLLSDSRIREISDYTIFVDTPEDVRFERRLTRDVESRGRTAEGVKAQFIKQVKPMHDEFVEPSKQYADDIVSGLEITAFNVFLNKVLKDLRHKI